MNKEKIERINFLARKSRNEGLTDEEKLKQQILRDEYRASCILNLASQLDNTYVVEPDGRKHKLGE